MSDDKKPDTYVLLDTTAEQFATEHPIADIPDPQLRSLMAGLRAEHLAPCATCGHTSDRHVHTTGGQKCSISASGVGCTCTAFVPR